MGLRFSVPGAVVLPRVVHRALDELQHGLGLLLSRLVEHADEAREILQVCGVLARVDEAERLFVVKKVLRVVGHKGVDDALAKRHRVGGVEVELRVVPPVPRLGLRGREEVPRVRHERVVHDHAAHEARVEAEQVELLDASAFESVLHAHFDVGERERNLLAPLVLGVPALLVAAKARVRHAVVGQDEGGLLRRVRLEVLGHEFGEGFRRVEVLLAEVLEHLPVLLLGFGVELAQRDDRAVGVRVRRPVLEEVGHVLRVPVRAARPASLQSAAAARAPLGPVDEHDEVGVRRRRALQHFLRVVEHRTLQVRVRVHVRQVRPLLLRLRPRPHR